LATRRCMVQWCYRPRRKARPLIKLAKFIARKAGW
jgi:hypothetical protein